MNRALQSKGVFRRLSGANSWWDLGPPLRKLTEGGRGSWQTDRRTDRGGFSAEQLCVLWRTSCSSEERATGAESIMHTLETGTKFPGHTLHWPAWSPPPSWSTGGSARFGWSAATCCPWTTGWPRTRRRCSTWRRPCGTGCCCASCWTTWDPSPSTWRRSTSGRRCHRYIHPLCVRPFLSVLCLSSIYLSVQYPFLCVLYTFLSVLFHFLSVPSFSVCPVSFSVCPISFSVCPLSLSVRPISFSVCPLSFFCK